MEKHECVTMSEFYRFPHTSHLAWIGEREPRDDKVLSRPEAAAFLSDDVVVEEKLDGANVGFSLSPEGTVRAQNRGQYLIPPYTGQFARLAPWLGQHEQALSSALTPQLILFGEWCAARHTLDYTLLPDLFLIFDVYDCHAQQFWSTVRRDEFARKSGLVVVPSVFKGRTNLESLKKMLNSKTSCFRSGYMEGVVVRRESVDWCVERAKLVRPDFIQTIGEHWRRRQIEWNRVRYAENGDE